MSLLTIIQDVCTDVGIPSPSAVVGSSNPQVVQLLQLAQREGKDLASRYQWRSLVRQQSITISTGATSQGALNGTVVSDSDVEYIINETFWNQTLDEPIRGPLSQAEIERVTALSYTGPYQKWYLLGKNLHIFPAPTAADTAQFAYKSKFWCETSGAVGQEKWAADDDVGRLNEDLMTLGVSWRWKRVKGLDYQEELRTYETRVADAMARDGGKRILSMAGSNAYGHGLIVPEGSWNL